ncbi:MAG: TetR family transcriptional regulator, partial [Acidimicrobiales bacterium]|nr:TetR family transcriptional regulator [Acidimicrobiales bacterium]
MTTSPTSEAATAPAGQPTRLRIVDEAERLFARRGIEGVATREIVEAAQQRNASA